MLPISALQFLGQEPQNFPFPFWLNQSSLFQSLAWKVQCGHLYKHKNTCVTHNHSLPRSSWNVSQWAHGLALLVDVFLTSWNQDTLHLCDVVWRTCNASGFQGKGGTFQLHLRARLEYVGVDDFEVFQDELCPLKGLC